MTEDPWKDAKTTTRSATERLIAFLNARLDEAEATAKAATAGPWRPETYIDEDAPAGVEHLVSTETHIVAGTGLGGGQAKADADHIALHDPDSTRRDIDADRKLIAAYENVAEYSDPWIGLDLAVRIRAERLSDHPDYRPEWKP